MFWQAATTAGNAVPGSVIQNVNDPTSFNKSHPKKRYPATGMLPMTPDHITVKIHLQAIGDDVLADLVASQDLDPAIPAKIARYELGGARRSTGRRRRRRRAWIRSRATRCCAWSSRSPTAPTRCPPSATRIACRRMSGSTARRRPIQPLPGRDRLTRSARWRQWRCPGPRRSHRHAAPPPPFDRPPPPPPRHHTAAAPPTAPRSRRPHRRPSSAVLVQRATEAERQAENPAPEPR